MFRPPARRGLSETRDMPGRSPGGLMRGVPAPAPPYPARGLSARLGGPLLGTRLGDGWRLGVFPRRPLSKPPAEGLRIIGEAQRDPGRLFKPAAIFRGLNLVDCSSLEIHVFGLRSMVMRPS